MNKTIKMRNIFIRLTVALAISCSLISAEAQSVKEEIYDCPDKAGNIYYNYHYVQQDYTEAPEGYAPFYISHYGRHGSRWLTRSDNYQDVKDVFDAAMSCGALTPAGMDVYNRVQIVYDDGIYRYGDLSRLGSVQHREIAGRMYSSFPEIFSEGAQIDAVSTAVPRCILSMAAFCERLKEFEPSLTITKEAGQRTTRYLNFLNTTARPEISDDFKEHMSTKAAWRQEYNAVASEYIQTERITDLLFSDEDFVCSIDAVDLVRNLYYFAVDMQDIDLGISFYDLFTPEELYSISIYENYRYFVIYGPSSRNKRFPEYYGKLLLQDFIEKADTAIENGTPSADLRFGHDVNIMPFITMLQFTEIEYDRDETDMAKVAESWTLYKLSPMATNIQFVFYRKEGSQAGDEVIVKIMHNEQEMHLPLESVDGPYYLWEDVKTFYSNYMDSVELPI